ncbi:MAG: mevalonate kinase [Nitrososphaerales archaeon]
MRYIARAPGKVILVGEHFVVHGAYAIAAAIAEGVRAEARKLIGSQVRIVSEDLGLTAELPNNIPDELYPVVKCVSATMARCKYDRGLELRLKSEIPPSAGLGSSAAAAVASVAATSSAIGNGFGLRETAELAMISEKAVHGNPSGIDVYTSTYGGINLFRKAPKMIKSIRPLRPFRMIVAYDRGRRQTRKLISKVERFRQSSPIHFSALITANDVMVGTVKDLIKLGRTVDVGAYLNFYQAILSSMSVSSPEIDSLVETSLGEGATGAKLTGAGGQGSIIAISPAKKFKKVRQSLSEISERVIDVTLPAQGVRVWTENS